MRSYASIAVLSTMLLAGCNTTESITPALKVAVNGKPLKVDIYYSINPDCSSLGSATAQVTAAPRHGTVEFREGTDFPYFRPDNDRAHCNSRRVPVTQVFYIPSPGYTGPDSFDTDVVFASGRPRIYHYKVEAR